MALIIKFTYNYAFIIILIFYEHTALFANYKLLSPTN